MIIVHDETLQVQHVLYEHPQGYENLIDAEGHSWVRTRQRIPVDQIVLGLHPQYGHRMVYHREHGFWLEIVSMSSN